jgi:hypothetical protein
MALTKITGEGVGAVDNLTVDTNTLHVDAANNRVGIGTTTPDSDLKIKSTGAATLRLDGGAVAASVGPLIVGEHNDADAFYIGTNSVVLGESSNQDVVIYGADSSSGNIRFYAGASTETARIRDGGGITFNGDTAAANALDDYEEGTWTSTLTSTGNPPSTAVTSTGRYTKVGNLVTLFMRFTNVNTTGATGNMRITGMPFNSASVTENQSAVPMMHGLDIPGKYVTAFIPSNTDTISFLSPTDDGVWSDVTLTAGTTKYFNMSISYQAQ